MPARASAASCCRSCSATSGAARPHVVVPSIAARRPRLVVVGGATSCIRVWSIRSAASTRSGRCSASPTSCSPPSRSAWRRRCSSKMGKLRYAWGRCCRWRGCAAATLTAAGRKCSRPIRSSASCRTRSRWPLDRIQRARMIFNDRIDAALALFFMIVVVVIVGVGARVDLRGAAGQEGAHGQREAPFVESKNWTLRASHSRSGVRSGRGRLVMR